MQIPKKRNNKPHKRRIPLSDGMEMKYSGRGRIVLPSSEKMYPFQDANGQSLGLDEVGHWVTFDDVMGTDSVFLSDMLKDTIENEIFDE